MNTKHRNTLKAIFYTPTRSNISFSDIEALVKAMMGGKVIDREGTRVILSVAYGLWHTHRPHPSHEVKKYQVESFLDFLKLKGIEP